MLIQLSEIFQIPVMVSNKIIKALHYWPFVTGIHWWPMDPSCKGPVMWKVFISISLYDHVMVIFLSLPDFCGDKILSCKIFIFFPFLLQIPVMVTSVQRPTYVNWVSIDSPSVAATACVHLSFHLFVAVMVTRTATSVSSRSRLANLAKTSGSFSREIVVVVSETFILFIMIIVNPLPAKFFRENINTYLHFM